MNGRLPNVHAWPWRVAGPGLDRLAESLRLGSIARLLLDADFAAADTLNSLAGRTEQLKEVVVLGDAGTPGAPDTGFVAGLERMGLERAPDDDRGARPSRARFRRPGSSAARPASWDGAWAGDDATVEKADSWLEVVTPADPWGYGAIVPLADVGPGDVVVRVTLRVLEGRIGLALMRSLSDLSLEIPLDASSDDQVVDLPFVVVGDAHDLLVRNHANAGAARCRLTKLELLSG